MFNLYIHLSEHEMIFFLVCARQYFKCNYFDKIINTKNKKFKFGIDFHLKKWKGVRRFSKHFCVSIFNSEHR